jgi:outer membrane protein assembly factor BamD (BamD/ComL family)
VVQTAAQQAAGEAVKAAAAPILATAQPRIPPAPVAVEPEPRKTVAHTQDVSMDPRYREARQEIAAGTEAFEAGRYDEAIEYFRRVSSNDIPSEDKGYACLMLAQCLMEQQNIQEALGVLEEASQFPGLSSEMQRDLLYYKGILSTVGKS